jgi:predicted SprT family Zn-dependent metalloprotease
MTGNITIDKLQHLWLQQLQLEFEEICLTYDLSLQPPVFEISNTRKEFGAWQSDTRTLRLSRHLILNYSWSVTIQVLKHEMAHQFCAEIFRSVGSPHGADFQQACELLGVLPEYRRAGSAVVEMVEQAAAGTKISGRGQACMARVAKLLALSQSANEHEAALAMQKANALIEKYHLEELGDDAEYRYGFGIIDRKRKRIESYQRRICTILHDFFFVRVVLSSLYDPLLNDTYKTIELLGTKENVAIAEYCYFFLENRLASLWSLHKNRFKGSVRTEKNSYYLGLLLGFTQKLQEQKRTTKDLRSQPHLGELVVADEKRLENFIELRFPRLKKAARSGARVYKSTYNVGVETGKTISLAEGLNSKSGTFGGFLPG